jgi:hypothetical protein
VGVVIPFGVGLGIYSDTTLSFELRNVALQVAWLFPVLSILLGLAWGATDLLGRDVNFVGFLACICCTFVLAPIGVGLPIVLNNRRMGKIVDLDIGIGAIMVMIIIAVCSFSTAANLKLRRIESEKKAKLAVFRLRAALKKISVLLDQSMGRILYDEFRLHNHKRQRAPGEEDAHADDTKKHLTSKVATVKAKTSKVARVISHLASDVIVVPPLPSASPKMRVNTARKIRLTARS